MKSLGYLIACLAVLGVAGAAQAQPADTLVTEAVVLARFEEARALAVDPQGLLYVADAGRDAVVRLDEDGLLRDMLGGPGTLEGRFSEPADIDPTNGLVFVVADAGNSRLQRFSRDFLHLESLSVGRLQQDERTGRGQPTAPFGQANRLGLADGTPIAVATSRANETFAVEAGRNVVLKWDAARRFERVIGGFDERDGRLVAPVALAVDENSLYVADRGRAAVLVYDHFGGFVRTLAEGLAREVCAVTVFGDEIWIVLPERLLVFHRRGRLARVFDVRLGEPLVDVGRRGGLTYLLTPSRLYSTVL